MKKLKNFLIVCFMLLVLVLLIANNIGFNFLEWGRGFSTESQNKREEGGTSSLGENLSEKYLSIEIKDHKIFVDQEEVFLGDFKETMESYDPGLFVVKLSSTEAKRITYQEVVTILKELNFSILE